MSDGTSIRVPSICTDSRTAYGAGPSKSSGSGSKPASSKYATASRGASHGGGPVRISAGPGGAGPTWQPLTTGSRLTTPATANALARRPALIASRVSRQAGAAGSGLSVLRGHQDPQRDVQQE